MREKESDRGQQPLFVSGCSESALCASLSHQKWQSGSALCKRRTQLARDEGMTFHVNLHGFADISDQSQSLKQAEKLPIVSAAEGEKCSYSICANMLGSRYQTHEFLSTLSPSPLRTLPSKQQG